MSAAQIHVHFYDLAQLRSLILRQVVLLAEDLCFLPRVFSCAVYHELLRKILRYLDVKPQYYWAYERLQIAMPR